MFDFFLEPLAAGHMMRALLITVLLGVSGGLLGCVLVLRRMTLMGNALAHCLLPGIVIAYILFGPSLYALFIGGLVAGLLTALGSAAISRLTHIKEDASFGALFILAFAVGAALLSRTESELDLMHFLFGNVLKTGPADLWLAWSTMTLTVVVFAVFYRSIVLETFDSIFHRAGGGLSRLTHFGIVALVVLNLVAALHAMGVVLALGLFLLPAVTATLWCDRWSSLLGCSVAVAVVGSAAGLILSWHLRISSGASIVITLGIIFIASTLCSPRHGFLRLLPRRKKPSSSVG